MKIKYQTLLDCKPLIFMDKIFRLFGYCIVLECDLDTGLYNNYFIDKVFKTKTTKPIGWYYYKVLCELGWKFRNVTIKGWDLYYWALNKMCNKYKINLYGQKL